MSLRPRKPARSSSSNWVRMSQTKEVSTPLGTAKMPPMGLGSEASATSPTAVLTSPGENSTTKLSRRMVLAARPLKKTRNCKNSRGLGRSNGMTTVADESSCSGGVQELQFSTSSRMSACTKSRAGPTSANGSERYSVLVTSPSTAPVSGSRRYRARLGRLLYSDRDTSSRTPVSRSRRK